MNAARELDYPAVSCACRSLEHHDGLACEELELLGFLGAGHAGVERLGDGIGLQPLNGQDREAAAPSPPSTSTPEPYELSGSPSRWRAL